VPIVLIVDCQTSALLVDKCVALEILEARRRYLGCSVVVKVGTPGVNAERFANVPAAQW
jgi:hypothetical protein